MTGLCLTHTVRLGAWAQVLPSGTQSAASRERRFSRWLHHPAIHPLQWYLPVVQAALVAVLCGKGRKCDTIGGEEECEMTKRIDIIPAPEPLEAYARHFDDLFGKSNQREGFRRYVEGLLLPTERHKTLTGLANTEPLVGAQKLQ